MFCSSTSLITSSSRVEESHQERMDWMIQEAARLGPNPGGVPHTFRHIVAGREYGWPIRVVETLRLQFFKCQPGGTPSPAPASASFRLACSWTLRSRVAITAE